jgi:hypothetical protein
MRKCNAASLLHGATLSCERANVKGYLASKWASSEAAVAMVFGAAARPCDTTATGVLFDEIPSRSTPHGQQEVRVGDPGSLRLTAYCSRTQRDPGGRPAGPRSEVQGQAGSHLPLRRIAGLARKAKNVRDVRPVVSCESHTGSELFRSESFRRCPWHVGVQQPGESVSL